MLPIHLINKDRPSGWLSEVRISRENKERQILGTEVWRVRLREDFGDSRQKINYQAQTQ